MKDIRYYTGRLGNQLFQFAYLYSQYRKGSIPDIYVQDESHFSEFSGEIRSMLGDDIGYEDLIAVHVRRSTNPINPEEPAYASNPFYVDLTQTDYYQRAMEQFKGETFIVFSDDIEWCKESPLFKGCIFSERRSEVDDMNYMASCKGHIIANSSFSWWAAFLSPHKGRVIAPKQWFSDGVERTKLPDHWERI